MVFVRGARADPRRGFFLQEELKILGNKLLLIGAVCAAPVLAGWILYLSQWTPRETGNYGELISPRPLSGPALDTLRGKWVLVAFDAAACDPHCERKLYFMRQVRKAQGKELERVERLWIVTDAAAPRPELLAAIEGTRIFRLGNFGLAGDFPGNPVEHIYLIDPLGNLMMRFPPDPDPSKMVKDLQRLLKYSKFG
jgi:hypothetical protein